MLSRRPPISSASARLLEYAELRPDLGNFDVVAFEGRGLISAAIRLFSGGRVTHVGMVLRWNGDVMLLESREFRGARIVHLSQELVGRRVHFFRLSATHLRQAELHAAEVGAVDALAFARHSAGERYGYLAVWRYVYRRLPRFVRALLPAAAADSFGRVARYCSQFISAIERARGVDPCPGLLDSETSPAELVASPVYEYLGTVDDQRAPGSSASPRAVDVPGFGDRGIGRA